MIEAEKQGFLEDEYVPYQESLDMKELGFDEPCLGYYHICNTDELKEIYECDYFFHEKSGNFNSDCLSLKAPLYQQAFRWLLKHHNLYGVIIPTETMNWTFKTMTVVEGIVEVPPYKHVDAYDYNTYEEAELGCLKKLIEIVKK